MNDVKLEKSHRVMRKFIEESKAFNLLKVAVMVGSEEHQYFELPKGLALSVRVNSHINSKDFPIEVALLSDSDAFYTSDPDESIISHMSWALFLDLLGDIDNIDHDPVERFQYYKNC